MYPCKAHKSTTNAPGAYRAKQNTPAGKWKQGTNAITYSTFKNNLHEANVTNKNMFLFSQNRTWIKPKSQKVMLSKSLGFHNIFGTI